MTTYFAALKSPGGGLPGRAFSTYAPPPPWWTAGVAEELVPPPDVAKKYKKGQITAKEFTEAYITQVLIPLNAAEIYKKYDCSLLVGYHAPDKHPRERIDNRFVIARWLERSLGVEIKEYIPEKPRRK